MHFLKNLIFCILILLLFDQKIFCQTNSMKKDSVSYIQFHYSKSIYFAQENIGTRYGKNGYDCSGLVMKAFKMVGVDLPHSSTLQSLFGQKVDKEAAQPGDLIFFSSGRSGKSKVGHVGIVVDNLKNNIRFIHSAVKGGVKYDFLSQDYYKKHFLFIKRNVFAQN